MIASITNMFLLIAQDGAAGDTTTTPVDETSPGGFLSGSSIQMFIYVALFVGVFYFLLIRPGQKQRRQHEQLVSSIGKGDEVMTAGGIYGTITKVQDDYVMVEVANKTEIKLSRNSIARTVGASGEEASEAGTEE